MMKTNFFFIVNLLEKECYYRTKKTDRQKTQEHQLLETKFFYKNRPFQL